MNPAAYGDYIHLFDALSHPARIKILGILNNGRQYVSELARMLNISRPLLYMHLKKLEAAHLVEGHLEISNSGKATNYYQIVPFDIHLTPPLMTFLSEKIQNTDLRSTQK